MRIDPTMTLGLMIDFQTKLMPKIYENEKLEINIVKLIEGLKLLGIPLIFTEQYKRGIGETIDSVKNAFGENFTALEKFTFSCCGEKEVTEVIKDTKKKNVIIAGIESHVCVLQTVLDLLNEGYLPIVIEDCVSARSINDKKISIDRMAKEGAIISTYESILFELCQTSKAENFKALSKIIK